MAALVNAVDSRFSLTETNGLCLHDFFGCIEEH